jgi:hypothetical protein
MAEWRKLAITLTLADGKIDDDEVKVLRRELWADGRIDRDEVEFLIQLRNAAQKKAKKQPLNPKFESLFFKAIEENVLEDGDIDDTEARWLREMLFADKKIDANEMKFMSRLNKAAKGKSPAFEQLYQDCQKMRKA